MSSDRDSRKTMLGQLIQSELGGAFSSDMVDRVLSAEDVMTQNREYFSVLHARRVLTDQEFSSKVNLCFRVFVEQAAHLLGEEVCKAIYDFAPGEEIELVNASRVAVPRVAVRASSTTAPGPIRRNALLIGNSQYSDPRLLPLPIVRTSVAELQSVLSSPAIDGYRDVQVLSDSQMEWIKHAIRDTLSRAGDNDLVLLYFSGHGVHDKTGNVFLATEDTDVDRLEQSAVPLDEMRRQIDQSKGNVLLILDACESTSSTPSESFEKFISILKVPHHGALITSRQPQDPQVVSVFTQALLEGLKGFADLDGDGMIGVGELGQFIERSLKLKSPNSQWKHAHEVDFPVLPSGIPADDTG